MKKFLAILLIAIISCEVVNDFDLKAWFDSFVAFLKQIGLLEVMYNKGKKATIEFCAEYFDINICESIINAIWPGCFTPL